MNSLFNDQKKNDGSKGDNENFLPGNKFWRKRFKSGRNRLFASPDELEAACFEYFDWVDDNPLWEMKVFSTGLQAKMPRPRAMTLQGLTGYIGMGMRTWADYRDRDEFKDVCQIVEDVMFDQKFAGAAAGLFSAVIIARDLGLADKKEIDGNLVVEVVDSYGENNDPE